MYATEGEMSLHAAGLRGALGPSFLLMSKSAHELAWSLVN
jgi:hypothetical protein